MLTGYSRETVRSFKSVRSFNTHLPVLGRTRSGDGNAPVALAITECVLYVRGDLAPQSRIAEILQLDPDSHHGIILSNVQCPVSVQTGRGSAGWVFQRIMNSLFTNRVENQAANWRKPRRWPRVPRRCGRLAGAVTAPEIGKAATLVMFQPSAPAREPTAWIHVPSQPLMRSPLSRSQTPASPRRVKPVFSGLVTPSGRPDGQITQPTSDWQGLFRQSFQPSTEDKLNSCSNEVNAIIAAKTRFL